MMINAFEGFFIRNSLWIAGSCRRFSIYSSFLKENERQRKTFGEASIRSSLRRRHKGISFIRTCHVFIVGKVSLSAPIRWLIWLRSTEIDELKVNFGTTNSERTKKSFLTHCQSYSLMKCFLWVENQHFPLEATAVHGLTNHFRINQPECQTQSEILLSNFIYINDSLTQPNDTIHKHRSIEWMNESPSRLYGQKGFFCGQNASEVYQANDSLFKMTATLSPPREEWEACTFKIDS